MSWGRQLAKIWCNYVPPSRPSISEIGIYTKYLRDLQNNLNRKIDLLILGSTVEFMDWGYEQCLNTTVIDFSRDYHLVSKNGIRYKNLKERFVHKRWQDMDFDNKFDIVIGDLIVGNLKSSEINEVLKKISNALTTKGIFMTKSIFRDENKKIEPIEKIIDRYYVENYKSHPFTSIIYDVVMSCMDTKKEILDFKLMYSEFHKLKKNDIFKKEIFSFFDTLGWKEDIKFNFYIPTFKKWEHMIVNHFNGYKKEYGEDIYSSDIPIYIIYK